MSFINFIISLVAGYSYFVVDLYTQDYEGTLISNPIADYYYLGVIFVLFAYFSFAFILYSLYLMYLKPWEETMKSYNKKQPWFLK
jgi:hypothetical protein